jgi:hypothetical protein
MISDEVAALHLHRAACPHQDTIRRVLADRIVDEDGGRVFLDADTDAFVVANLIVGKHRTGTAYHDDTSTLIFLDYVSSEDR